MEDRRTRSQRLSDSVTHFCGTWAFILVFSVGTVIWIAGNTVWLLFGKFDPYPFIALNLVYTVISTFQGPLIMMSQNRQDDRDREAVQGLHQKLDRLLEEKT